MKKILTISFSLIFFLGFALTASASAGEALQPASGPTYDSLTVNGSGYLDSIKIGGPNGGVTFFNGSIVNENPGTPVTFGDDVRIDGRAWRGLNAGPGDGMPFIINDDFKIQGNTTVNGVSGLTDADIPNNITASNYMPLSGGNLTGNLTASKNVTLGDGTGREIKIGEYSGSDNVGVYDDDWYISDIGKASFNAIAINDIIHLPGSTATPATCLMGDLFVIHSYNDCDSTVPGDGVLCVCNYSGNWKILTDL